MMKTRRPPVPLEDITRKLDSDFFAGRWARATDRQRELLRVIAELPNCDAAFTVQEIVENPINRETLKSFGSSHVNQMLSALSDAGLVSKNRHGKYSLAVPVWSKYSSCPLTHTRTSLQSRVHDKSGSVDPLLGSRLHASLYICER
jgi:hypothetical protein